MKLVRYGQPGAERSGILDRNGAIRDLSGVVRDIDGSALTP
jgi:2,4-diketo-3-deoxy-L-fuconate hydrolase